jgi:2,3-bisphosphoglycerate-independent phosphoglycerate mutase
MVALMKLVVLLGDGMADLPLAALQGKTPLQAAKKPNMDLLAKQGKSGLAQTVPEGFPPGSDVANLCVMGYAPSQHYTGRAPLEAAAMGVALGEGDIAFRCNFVTIEGGVMLDYSAGHITTEEGRELIEALQPLMPERRLYAGVSYRNLQVLQAGAKAICTPPHDISDQSVAEHRPRGPDAELLVRLMEVARPVLARHPVNQRRIAAGKRPANAIWLWGQGPAPFMPSFAEKYGLKGAMISAVDLLKGIGRYAGLEVVEVAGATGTIDTNYEGKVQAALEALKSLDFVYLHIEAPDEAGHEGNTALKVRAIELFDERVVGPVVKGLQKSGQDWRVLLLPDHATPISIKTHSRDPVPFTISGTGIVPDGVERFDEQAAKQGGYGLVEATKLVGIMGKESLTVANFSDPASQLPIGKAT